MALEHRHMLSTFTVTSTADDGTGGTLRWAVAKANSAATASTIAFDLGSGAATITLTAGDLELTNSSAPIAIDDDTGQGPVTVNGNDESSVFVVDSGVTASFSDITIAGGAAGYAGGGLSSSGTATLANCVVTANSAYLGGGIVNYGMMTVSDTTISDNSVQSAAGGSAGGGVWNYGTILISGCTISDNASGYGAGGVGNDNGGTMTIVDSTIDGNSASVGAGVDNEYGSTMTVTGCTISGNSGHLGTGVWNRGTIGIAGSTINDNTTDNAYSEGAGIASLGAATLANCTISGNNSAGKDGGIAILAGTATLEFCTISDNYAALDAGGLYISGALTLTDTIVADNTGCRRRGQRHRREWFRHAHGLIRPGRCRWVGRLD